MPTYKRPMITHQKIIIGINPVLRGETVFLPKFFWENVENRARVSSIWRCFSRSRCRFWPWSLSCNPMMSQLPRCTVIKPDLQRQAHNGISKKTQLNQSLGVVSWRGRTYLIINRLSFDGHAALALGLLSIILVVETTILCRMTAMEKRF